MSLPKFSAFILLSFAATSFGQVLTGSGQVHKGALGRWNLRGPIETQLCVARKLEPDPRTSKILQIAPFPTWLKFDRQGNAIETGNKLDANQHLVGLTHTEYDEHGYELHSYQESAAHKVDTRYERKYGQYGPTEEIRFVNGKAQRRRLFEYDAHGFISREKQLTPDGRIPQDRTWTRDAKGNVLEQTESRFGQFYSHFRDTYDAQENLTGHTEFDDQGKAVCNITLDPSTHMLGRTWKAPGWNGYCHVGWSSDIQQGVTRGFQTERDGHFYSIEAKHPGRTWIMEDDEVEDRDESGRLVDKLKYEYERDPVGNWTKRISYLLDPASGRMVPIQEDRRTLTYYPDEH